MNRAERRQAARVRRVIENAPRDAQGEMILITGPEVALCAYASEFLVRTTAELARLTPGAPERRADVAQGMERDRLFLTAAVASIRSAGPVEDARLVPPRELLIPMWAILGCWRRSEEAIVPYLAEFPDAPPFREVMTLLGQSVGLDTPPDWEAMAALNAKLQRIADAMNGETGLEA